MTTLDAGAADVPPLAAALGRALVARGWMVTAAESCTGGLVAAAMTSVPGSSQWFERGFVTYSNDAKSEMLGVPSATLILHGAVSEACAAEMALGALRHSHAQLAVAVTGIAGPGGAVPDKPVGTVCFGWAVRGEGARTATHLFRGDRSAVRAASVRTALEGLLARAGAVMP